MSEIRLNRLVAETEAPANADRLVIIPAGAFTTSGTDAQREATATAPENLPKTWTLESLRTYFQISAGGGVSNFLALTDTPSSFGTAGQFLAVNTETNALEFVDAPSGGVSNFLALTDTPSSLGTAGQFLAVNTAANALEFVDAPSGGGQAETGATIVSKLAALAGGDRLSYTALRDTPAIPVLRTAAQTVALLEGLAGNARLDAAAIKNLPTAQGGGLASVNTDATLTGLGTTASPLAVARPFTAADDTKLLSIQTGAQVNRTPAQIVSALEALTGNARLSYSALDGVPDIPDAEVDEFQFAVATVSQELQADDALGNATAGNTVGKDLSFANTRDAAALGFTDASGRLSFGNTHTDRDTNLIITGRVPITHIGLGGRLRVLFREFLATTPDTVNREVEVANHPITESSALRSFHFPVTGTQVRVRRNRTYKVFVEFTAEAGASANGQVSVAYTLDDNANLIAFNRFQLRLTDLADTPSTLGTAGQVLAVSSGGNLLEFVDAATGGGGAQTSLELFSTLREANALTSLANDDTLFGWDASSSAGVEMSLANLKSFINQGENFLSLTDTPSAFGTAGQFLAINNAANALEFVETPTDIIRGGIGPNLLNAPTGPISIRSDQGLSEVIADIGFRLEDGKFYAVILERASQNHNLTLSPMTQMVGFQDGYGECVFTHGLSNFTVRLEFRNAASGNTALWSEGTTHASRDYIISGIYTFAEAEASSGTFPQVDVLPAAIEFNQTADLTQLDLSNNAPPGLYRTINNPIERRNRTIATIGVDPLVGNIYGFSLDANNTWGHVDNAGMVGKLVWSTGAVPYVNIGLNTALMGERTQVYIDFGSSEFGTDITRRIRFNRGSVNGNFPRGGIVYRDWTVDTTEIDQSSDEVIQRLTELQDTSGDNEITIDVYDAATGGNPINHLPEFIWQGLLEQEALQPFLERENKSNRVLRAERIFADNNRLRSYQTETAAIADGVLLERDLVYKVRNETPGSAEDTSRIFTVDGAIPGSGGTRGSVSHRNRFSALLLTMGNNSGFYYTAQYRSALRTFNNVQNADDIDPNNHIVWMSFYDSGSTEGRPYVDVGIDPELTTANRIAMLIGNRETSTGGDAPQLDLTLTRTGQTGTFGGKTGNGYRFTLNATQAAALGTAGWLFKDDTIIVDFLGQIRVSESVLNINPDEVQFTSGTGYVAPSNPVAATARQINRSPTLTNIPITGWRTQTGVGTAATNLDVWTHTVTAAQAGGVTVIHADFMVSVTSRSTDANRTQADYSLVHRRGLIDTVLERQTRYIRYRRAGQLFYAGFALDGKMENLRAGDLIIIRSRSQGENQAVPATLEIYNDNAPAYISLLQF